MNTCRRYEDRGKFPSSLLADNPELDDEMHRAIPRRGSLVSSFGRPLSGLESQRFILGFPALG